jgi:hypothetical protein
MTRMLWLLVFSTAALGCNTLSEAEFFGAGTTPAKPGTSKPTSIYAIWQEGVDMQLDPRQGGLAIPGFSGKVNLEHKKPGSKGETVLSQGTLMISFYPDMPGQPMSQPMETWKILPEHQSSLLKQDLSGFGYVLWLPWNTYNPNIRSGRITVEYISNTGEVLQAPPERIKIQDPNRLTTPRPELLVEQQQKKTWQ